jgi:hypothetical protein
MINATKIVLPIAIILGAASAALAAPGDAPFPRDTTRATSVQQKALDRASGRTAFAVAPGRSGASQLGRLPETYIEIQSRGVLDYQ